MSSGPGWLKRLLTAALIGAAFLFLGREIFRNVEDLRDFRWDLRPLLLLLSVGALVTVLLWGVWVWRLVIRRFGVHVPLRALARAWFLANLSRYIPGMVWQFVSLAQLGPSVGLSPSATIVTLLAHVGFALLSAGVIGSWLLPLSYAGDFAPVIIALRWLSPLSVALVHPAVIRLAIHVVVRVTGRGGLQWQGSWLDGLGLLGLSAVSWVLYGVAFFLFLASFVPLPLSDLPAVTAINALAWTVGYLAVFAPGGLGFREGAIAVLSTGMVPTAVAASLAIASRLWTVAAEVIPALFLARRAPVPESCGEPVRREYAPPPQ